MKNSIPPAQPSSRRSFLRQTARVSAAGVLSAGFPAIVQARDANQKLQIAVIGSGGRGSANLGGVSKEQIVALCDVNRGVLDHPNLLQRYPDVKRVTDWRTLVGETSIDAFVISTADHHHAVAAVAAMKAGKHVYCEKPLGHTVHEARVMQEVYRARKDALATQMGTQIHADNNYRRVVELVQAGAIGPVREAHVWCSRSISNIGAAVLPEMEKPDSFDWESWLGPAAFRPYNEGYWKGGNLNWNRRWDFGNGVLGDMGSHLNDLPFWALGLRRPSTVEAEGPEVNPHSNPPWLQITWEHAARPQMPEPAAQAVKLVWYHGPEGMRRMKEKFQGNFLPGTDLNQWPIGCIFVGDEGLLLGNYSRLVLSPAEKFANFQAPAPTIPPSMGHYNEWIHACKNGGASLCNFDYSGVLIENNLLGNVAFRTGKKLIWDGDKGQCTNSPEANALLTKTYRTGWELSPEG